MSDYYHQFLSSMAGVGGHPGTNQQDGLSSMPQPPGMPMGPGTPLTNPYQSLGYFTGFPEPIMFNAPKTQRSRRKSAPGLDHIKHRRTRSGCYTCRSRRVKCDETHPICERCRKGKRECIYPEPTPPKGSTPQGLKDSSGPSAQTSPTSSNGYDEEDVEQDAKLDPIMDEDEDEPESATTQSSTPGFPPPRPRRSSTASSSFALQRFATGTRQESETPSFEGTKSSSPSVSTGTTSSLTPAPMQLTDVAPSFSISGTRPDWSFLPHELQFYLNYFYENITHYHYCMVNDSDDFFRSILTSMAIRDEALLYAVVGFAAYHYTLTTPNGKIKEFLQYYNRSVTLLLAFLKKKEKHSVTTLLTILQLATIEEYLGDWVNLMGHQKAAFEILTHLFTPQSAMQSPVSRMMLTWYARFDVFIGIMGSFQTALPREWFSIQVNYYDSRAAAEPDNVGWKFEACAARLRLISMEMSILLGKGAKQEITEAEYVAEHRRLNTALHDWKDTWDPALQDSSYLVTDFPSDRSPDPNDIVNPFAPGVLYMPPLFASTILTCEWHSIALMHESQAASEPREETRAMLMKHSYTICQICETVEFWQHSPGGSLIILHPCLAIASLFVPRDARHHMWIRRKFALLEVMGYISPLTMRTRMAELFQDEGCVRWWLPNDEGFTPILQSIRTFADERNATAVSAQSENIRQVRHVFSKMQIGAGSEGAKSGGTDKDPASA
ncbi:hypothetical protein QBC46DRAFT_361616 [Diplogelasinospora grovesii]|uniref:Zn(2)-C6 fungal-type domain-containing protein n=1 Tax=Diplogelasinospora grovesii TaxID=303347 RepID=A0AAN6NE99_9PEZI|nr:hypothetical protein QBC46DRAFT_361616 [Diplogelasinospora grovesii]